MSSLGAEEAVVPESELKKAKVRIRELERLLGKKTMEAEILREGMEFAREKNCCCGRAGQNRTIPNEANC